MNTEAPFVSTAEAAFIAGMEPTKINRLVDEQLVPHSLYARTDGSRRVARLCAVFAKFFFGTEATLLPGARKQVLAQLTHRFEALHAPHDIFSLHTLPADSDWQVHVKAIGISIDLLPFVHEVMSRVGDVESADRLVVTDASVMGGAPCFAGSRVPIDVVLGSVDKGVEWPRLQASYPFLTHAHVDAARVYQKVHPQRGRPRLRDANGPERRRIHRVVRPAGK